MTDKEFPELIFSNETSKELNTDTKTITNNLNENCCNYCLPENFCKITPTNLFYLLHVNIRSIYKNIDLLEELISKLSQTPDIIALTETKINPLNAESKIFFFSESF